MATVSELQQQIARKDAHIDQLESMVLQLRQALYGPKSEKQAGNADDDAAEQLALGLFDEAEAVAAQDAEGAEDTAADAEGSSEDAAPADRDACIEVPAYQRKPRGRPKLPDDLPREDIIHDLTEADRCCPHDGQRLVEIGSDISEQLTVIPTQYKVLRHIRKKYACPHCDGHVATAARPPQPIPKSIATPALLAQVAVAKYVDGRPLYRQVAQMQRLGVSLHRATLANWMVRCGALVQPLINLLRERQWQQPVIHLDETPLQVLRELDKAATSQSYMWVTAAGPPSQASVLYHYAPTRSGTVPLMLLEADYAGAIMVDGHAGYGAAERLPGVIRLGCWVHARRKFMEAKRAMPRGKTGRADIALKHIQSLYRIERLAQTKAMTTEQRYQLRQDKAAPLVATMRTWLEQMWPATPPKTALGKALGYLHEQWPRLVRYLDDGAYPIDNNRVENAIRPFAIGRKHWLFANTPKGAEASANLYSLVETAKANGLEPAAYLERVLAALPSVQTVADIEALLPSPA